MIPSNDAALLIVAFNDRVFGVDPSDGRRVWSQRIVGSFDADASYRLAPADDVVIVGRKKLLVCLDRATGAERWRSDSPVFVGELLVASGRIFVGSSGEVAAFDLTGRLLWHDPYEGCGNDVLTLAMAPSETRA